MKDTTRQWIMVVIAMIAWVFIWVVTNRHYYQKGYADAVETMHQYERGYQQAWEDIHDNPPF